MFTTNTETQYIERGEQYMVNTIVTNEVEKKKEEAAELLKLMERVPQNKKERVLGIIEGVAMSAELEAQGA